MVLISPTEVSPLMFFTKIATIIAYFGVVLGVWKVVAGFFIAFSTETLALNMEASKHYLGTSTSGEAINEGCVYLGISITLGVLTEISKSISARNDPARIDNE